MTIERVSAKAKGNAGEKKAVEFLEKNGYTIVKRNFKKVYGEVDIIGKKGDVLVFTEVKFWTSLDSSSMEHALNRKKMRTIVKISKAFLMENPSFNDFHIRYDVIFIGRDGAFRHIPSAFTENETA